MTGWSDNSRQKLQAFLRSVLYGCFLAQDTAVVLVWTLNETLNESTQTTLLHVTFLHDSRHLFNSLTRLSKGRTHIETTLLRGQFA